MLLQNADIPILIHRTKEQSEQLKILSGHSVNCQSHKWVKTPKNPVLYTTVREPVERLLSSFNYKYQKTVLWQNKHAFPYIMPKMKDSAIFEEKGADDYDTLYEYLLDNNFEQNLQAKWIIKTFFDYDYRSRYFSPVKFYERSKIEIISDNSLTTPNWMEDNNIIYSSSFLDECINKMWWISDFKNLEEDTKFLCNKLNIAYNKVPNYKKNTSRKVKPKWTVEDVKKQHDFGKLKSLLTLDYYLYEKIKIWERPDDLPSYR